MWEVLSSLISSNVTLGTMKLSASFSVIYQLNFVVKMTFKCVTTRGINSLKMGCGTHDIKEENHDTQDGYLYSISPIFLITKTISQNLFCT